MMNTIKELRKDEVLIIGVGLGGCAIAQNLHDRGYSCLFINSATGDLNNLIGVDEIDKLHYKGADGAGGNREFGKEFAEQNINNIFKRVDKQYNSSKYIFVAFSTAGGTGSGGGTYIIQELYKRYSPNSVQKQESVETIPVKDRHVGCIAILPSQFDDGGTTAHRNALACYEEIESLVEAKLVNAVMLLDNSKKNRLAINRQFAEDFDNLISITSQTDGTGKGIDSGDLVNALSGNGYLYMASFTVPEKGDSLNIIGSDYMPKFVRNECHAILATANIDKEDKSDMIMYNFKKYFSPADSISKMGFIVEEDEEKVESSNKVYGFGLDIPQEVKLQIRDMHNKEMKLKKDSRTVVAKIKVELEEDDKTSMKDVSAPRDIIASTIPKEAEKPEKKLTQREIALLRRMGKL